MFIKSRILVAGAVSALALTACGLNDTPQVGGGSKDAVAATVNGTPISERLVNMMLKQRTDLGRTASAEVRKGYIENLAMQVIVTQEAVKKGLDKVPDVADRI